MKKVSKVSFLFVILQGLLTVGTLVFIIISFFQPEFKMILPFCFGITLLILAFNNFRIYKKKALTITYLIFGILSIVYGIIKLGV